jgi:hypothetical protein
LEYVYRAIQDQMPGLKAAAEALLGDVSESK